MFCLPVNYMSDFLSSLVDKSHLRDVRVRVSCLLVFELICKYVDEIVCTLSFLFGLPFTTIE